MMDPRIQKILPGKTFKCTFTLPPQMAEAENLAMRELRRVLSWVKVIGFPSVEHILRDAVSKETIEAVDRAEKEAFEDKQE